MSTIYAVATVADVTEEQVSCCCEDSLDTVRKSNDGLRGILKWHPPTPECCECFDELTLSELKALIYGTEREEWNTPRIEAEE